MHTYFINTSTHVSTKLYDDVLLGSLLAKKQLIIPEGIVTLDRIANSSEMVAKKIDEEADISESAAFLIFMDIIPEQTASKDEMRAYAVADELVLSMKVETSLVWKLCEMGKQPQKLIFVFAERISRENEILEDLVNERIWYDFGLPNWENLKRIVKEHYKEIEEGKTVSNSLAKTIEQYLIENAEQERIADKNNSFWGPVVHLFSETTDHDNADPYEWDQILWQQNLRSALDTYIKTTVRDFIHNQFAINVEYWHQTWEERDPKEKNRSECRLMLFLYAAAYDGVQGYGKPLLSYKTIANQTPAMAYEMPAINLPMLRDALAVHYQQCVRKVYKETEMPKKIHEELAQREPGQETLIDSQYDPPELIPEMLLSRKYVADSKISLKQIISILSEGEEGRKTVIASKEKTLSDQIKKIIMLIRQLCTENSIKIQEYISRITNEYDRIKDHELEKLPFTAEDCPDFTRSEDNEREKMRDELDNIERNVDKLIADAERELLQPVLSIPKSINMDKEIKQAEEQTTYYLHCLKIRLAHLIFWVLFILAVIIPYFVTKTQVLNNIPGYLFLCITAGLAFGALVIGYLVFYKQYNKKTHSVMDHLICKFISSQKENFECIESFRNLLYRKIPRCYGLHHYRNMLVEYKEESRLRRLKITFHETAKEKWRREIAKLMDNLDLGDKTLLKQDAELAIVDPDEDCAGNAKVYILSSEEVRQSLVQGDA